MSHLCKMMPFLATSMKLMMNSLFNWTKIWNQMKSQYIQVTSKSNKQSKKIKLRNKKQIKVKVKKIVYPSKPQKSWWTFTNKNKSWIKKHTNCHKRMMKFNIQLNLKPRSSKHFLQIQALEALILTASLLRS